MMSVLDKPIKDLSKPLFEAGATTSRLLSFEHNQKQTERHIATEGMSHVIGSKQSPLIDKSIPDFLAEIVRQHLPHDAVVFLDKGIRWSWQEFSERIDALAAGFLALGLTKGDRIGIWSPNRPEWVLTQFATARIGVILVTINPAYRIAELEHVLNASGCAALVTARKFKASNYLAMIQELVADETGHDALNLRVDRLPSLKMVICMKDPTDKTVPDGLLDFDAVMSMAGPAHRGRLDSISATINSDDAINIQFTSGTTGAPKGATLSHSNILNNAKFTTDTMEFTHQDKLCIPVPLYHCFGMVMGALGCVTKGATMVFPGEGFDPAETLSAIANERCTALYGVPTMFNAMLTHERFTEFDLSSLRTGVMAGAPCPIETMNRVVNEMHMSGVTIAYGMTETSPVSFQSNIDDPLEKRVSTVGRVHPHVECCITDSNGDIVPLGEKGELCTRGYSVMKGYWGDEIRTKEAIDADGWMHSGDLAIFDSEGYCNVVGRVKDMVIRGGENVYPKEVEDFLYRNDKVKDVQVFGIPDSKFGEEVCAWVVPKDGSSLTEEEIKDFCQGQIAHYKIPRYVRIRSELPMTVSGKAQKFKMREEMIDELNLTETKTA